MLRAFNHAALELNLKYGRGAVQLPQVTRVIVGLGQDPVRGPLGHFYVNELPRLYHLNKNIQFSTIQGETSSLVVEKGSQKTTVPIQDCDTSASIYSRFIKAAES